MKGNRSDLVEANAEGDNVLHHTNGKHAIPKQNKPNGLKDEHQGVGKSMERLTEAGRVTKGRERPCEAGEEH